MAVAEQLQEVAQLMKTLSRDLFDFVEVDRQFREGAEEALRIAKENGIDLAILQSRSPSCGVKQIYDGNFTGKLIPGQGVFAQLLEKNGFRVMDCEEI